MWVVVALTEVLVVLVVFRRALGRQLQRLETLWLYPRRMRHEEAMARLAFEERVFAHRAQELENSTPEQSKRVVSPMELPRAIEDWAREESEEWAREDRRQVARQLYVECGGDWGRVAAHLSTAGAATFPEDVAA